MGDPIPRCGDHVHHHPSYRPPAASRCASRAFVSSAQAAPAAFCAGVTGAPSIHWSQAQDGRSHSSMPIRPHLRQRAGVISACP